MGIVLDLIGWALFILAARVIPLFLALSFVASSLVVTAMITRFYFKTSIKPAMTLAMVAVIIGILLLGITAQPSTINRVNRSLILAVEVSLIPIATVGLILLRSHRKHSSALLLALLAGLTFGATGLLARAIHFPSHDFGLFFQVPVLSLGICGILGTFFLAAALQRADITIVNGILYSSELSIPSLLGILFLGDRARNGLWLLMMTGFLCVAVGTILLALKARSVSYG
jgi:drug/metabolite transporter (DMT)-like permease